MHGAVPTTLVSEARSKTVSTVIGCSSGSLLRRPYALTRTAPLPCTTAITAPGTSPRATAPLAASSMAAAIGRALGVTIPAAVALGGGAAETAGAGVVVAEAASSPALVLAVGAGPAGAGGDAREHPSAARAARASV